MSGGRDRMAARPVRAAHRLGRRAEWAALIWLLLKGYRLRDRRWSCGLGELDLVMQRGGVIVFVEVKARSSSSLGGAAGAVDHAKRSRLVKVASQYLGRYGLWERPCRFDVVLVERRSRHAPGAWRPDSDRCNWLQAARRRLVRSLRPAWRLCHVTDAFRPDLGRQL